MKKQTKTFFILVFGIILLASQAFSYAEYIVEFTEEEIEYIRNRGPVKLGYIDGMAPLQYMDHKGNPIGITYEILEEIEAATGLSFEYKTLDINDDNDFDKYDMISGFSSAYLQNGYILSEPYLNVPVVFFINKKIQVENLNDLDNRIYAYVHDNHYLKFPNSILYPTREASLQAVNNGEADFGFGNIYTVNFYITQDDLRYINTIPSSFPDRDYRFLYPKEDRLLKSIIDKAIIGMDKDTLNAIMIKGSMIRPGIKEFSIHEVFKAFQVHISLFLLVVIFLIGYYILKLRKTKKELDLENRRFLILSNISNELIYQYEPSRDEIHFIGQGSAVFKANRHYEVIVEEIKKILRQNVTDGHSSVRVHLQDEEDMILRIYHFNIDTYAFGKIIDITDEIEQREYLIQRARIDGLTNLYNATYTKEYIDDLLKSKPEDRQDALLVIDLDNFKHFNDIYGHLRGDFILQEVAMALITSFEEARIIGRIGGDEFVVYLEDVVMENGECYQANNFMKELQKIDMDEPITASIGVKVIDDRSSYIEAFEDADRALYDIKDKKNQIGIYKGDRNGKV